MVIFIAFYEGHIQAITIKYPEDVFYKEIYTSKDFRQNNRK